MLTGLSMVKKLKLSFSLLIFISLFYSLNHRLNWHLKGENVCLRFWNQCKTCILNMSRLSLFDTHVLRYEIWCFHKGNADERIHVEYLKMLLKVKQKNPLSLIIFNKLGRLPRFIQRKICIVKFLCKLLYSENCSIKKIISKMCLKKTKQKHALV